MLKHISKALCLLSCSHAVFAASVPKPGPIVPPESAIQAAAKIPTGHSGCSTKFFPQPVHHNTFNGDWNDTNATFLQQYQLIDQFYKPGGPILFFQSPEDPYSCLEYQALYGYAKELGALAVGLEHRYFGLSCPYGLNFTKAATWETSQMDGMTLDNVLSDGVSLLSWLTAGANPVAKGAKVIVFGASYGGSLAAMYRTHHPEIIYGSIAASPVIDGVITNPNNSLVYALGDWLNMVYSDLSAEAADKIKASMADVRNRIAAGNFTGIQEALKLCNPLNSSDQAESVAGLLTNAYFLAAQYDAAVSGFPMDAVINATLALNDSLAIVSAPIPFNLHIDGTSCSALSTAREGIYTRNPFDYAICTYIPYPRTLYTRAQSIFGSYPPDFSAQNINQARCQGMWGIDAVDGGLEHQQAIRIDKATLEKASRILISEGLYDPITALGVGLSAWLPSVDRNTSRVLFISQGSHGPEFLMPNASDPQAVTEAREYEVNSIKEWLGIV